MTGHYDIKDLEIPAFGNPLGSSPTGPQHTNPSLKTFAVEPLVEIILGVQGFQNKKEGLNDMPFPPSTISPFMLLFSFKLEESQNSFPKSGRKNPPLNCLS